MLFWALIFFSLGDPVVIINITETKEQCEIVKKEYLGSMCYSFRYYNNVEK
jgi:hypothetical protein